MLANDFGRILPRTTVEECQQLSVKDVLKKLRPSDLTCIYIDSYKVYLTNTDCNYGGLRYWFKCPECHLKVGKLYKKPLANKFLCRHCNDLVYELCRYHRSWLEPLLKTIRGSKKHE